jgi:hypothetical protein
MTTDITLRDYTKVYVHPYTCTCTPSHLPKYPTRVGVPHGGGGGCTRVGQSQREASHD